MKIVLGMAAIVIGCSSPELPLAKADSTQHPRFAEYWYQGQAELNRFELRHARYGEIRTGNAVMIFVTEDFRTDKWVKLENYEGEGKAEAVSILKANISYDFLTGVYPYTLMTSVFTPVELGKFPHSLKVSQTVSEWCGHVYTQLLNKGGHFDLTGHSYFEREADVTERLATAWLEDEVWTRIRLSPNRLPVGSIQMIPGLKYARLMHRPSAVEKANATLEVRDSLTTYTVQYPELDRELRIRFRSEFPYEILEFEETYKDGFGANAKRLTTSGKRTHVAQLDYWSRNSLADSTYRSKLGLKP